MLYSSLFMSDTIDEVCEKPSLLGDITRVFYNIGIGTGAGFLGGYLANNFDLDAALQYAEFSAIFFTIVEGLYGIPSKIYEHVKGKSKILRSEVAEIAEFFLPFDVDGDNEIGSKRIAEGPSISNCIENIIGFTIGVPIACFFVDIGASWTEAFTGFNPIAASYRAINEFYEHIPALAEYVREEIPHSLGFISFKTKAIVGASYAILYEASKSLFYIKSLKNTLRESQSAQEL